VQWASRYRSYASRKTEAATAAHIPGYSTDVDLTAGRKLTTIGDAWARERFAGPFFGCPPPDDGLPATSLVFVRSRDGNTETRSPQDLGGGATDVHVVYEGLSRVAADAVLIGAQTLGRDDTVFSVWHPAHVATRFALGKRRHPTQVVASENGALPIAEQLLFNVPDIPVVILTADEGARRLAATVAARPWITLRTTGARSDLRLQLRALAAAGLRRISAVGGRHLATALIDAHLVQEVYLTTGTRSGGTPGTPYYIGRTPPAPTLALRKRGLEADAGVVFEHFLL
jgi:riboflavin biosynthesis pyrimidine reductase